MARSGRFREAQSHTLDDVHGRQGDLLRTRPLCFRSGHREPGLFVPWDYTPDGSGKSSLGAQAEVSARFVRPKAVNCTATS